MKNVLRNSLLSTRKTRLFASLCLALPCVFFAASHANESSDSFLERENVRSYITQLSAENDLDKNRVAGYFVKLRSQQSILDAISTPAERTLTWREYRPIFVTERRIREGKAFLAEHNELLSRAEERFGVPASIITAIIGVETYYGRITGSYGVLEALATLAFDYPPRSEFFTREMGEFIVLSEKEGWDTLNVKGSYAGAMGWPQFISSSYREYAVDFDDDGKRDLFNSPADIIGSVGNYLARHGWIANAPIAELWTNGASITAGMRALVSKSLKPAVTANQIKELGFASDSLASGTQSKQAMSVMDLAGDRGEELWVGYRNFYAITRYNHSRLYAMAVHQLAGAIDAKSQI